MTGERGGLVLGNQSVAIGDLHKPRIGDQISEAPSVRTGHDPLLGGPHDKRRAVEGAQALNCRQHVALLRAAHVLRQIAPDLRLREQRTQPAVSDLVRTGRLVIQPSANGRRRKARTRMGCTSALMPPGSRPASATVFPGNPGGKFSKASQDVITSHAIRSGNSAAAICSRPESFAHHGHVAQVQTFQELGLQPCDAVW